MGSKKIPAIDYKLYILQEQREFALWQTYLALDYFNSNNGPGSFNRDTYGNGAFIYALDLSRDGSPNTSYVNSTFEAASLSVDGTFREGTDNLYTGRYEIKMYKRTFLKYRVFLKKNNI